MAYLCPVCEEPQVDAAHLANHLAFTALIRGGDHESWLDGHVPDWGDHDESWLAEQVRETLEAVDHPVDDIETGGHEAAHGGSPAVDPVVAADGREGGELGDDAQSVVEEARELTRRMVGGDTDGDDDSDTDSAGGAVDDDGPAEDETD